LGFYQLFLIKKPPPFLTGVLTMIYYQNKSTINILYVIPLYDKLVIGVTVPNDFLLYLNRPADSEERHTFYPLHFFKACQYLCSGFQLVCTCFGKGQGLYDGHCIHGTLCFGSLLYYTYKPKKGCVSTTFFN
jgi:hypothetical protein